MPPKKAQAGFIKTRKPSRMGFLIASYFSTIKYQMDAHSGEVPKSSGKPQKVIEAFLGLVAFKVF